MVARSNPTGDHLAVLDGLRGVAILLVLLFHALGPSFGTDAPGWDGWHRAWPLPGNFFVLLPAYLGWAGVPIFFIVSGFCIHLSHQKAGARWRIFFLRRFFRIYPPYLAALLFFALILPATRLDFQVRHNLDQLLSHLLLVHNNLGPGFLYGINPSFWSIGVEVQLYLLYPALMRIVRQMGWRGMLFLAGALEIALRTAFSFFPGDNPARFWLLGDPFLYWFSWTLGAWLCECRRTGEQPPLPTSPALLWLALAVASYFFSFTYGFGFLLWSLATAALLAKILSQDQKPAFLAHPLLRRIGWISYSVYLLHQPLLGCLGFAGPTGWIAFMICLGAVPGILLLSQIFHCLVERPSVALGRQVESYWLGSRFLHPPCAGLLDPKNVSPGIENSPACR